MKLPVWITDLPKIDNRDYYYQELVKQHLNHTYDIEETRSSNNFEIADPDGVWDILYQQFFNKCEELFGPLTLYPENSRACWAFTSNNTHYLDGIHNHRLTSTINGVYYFSVPKSSYYEGSLVFYDETKTEELWVYKPREQDLVIFPGFLNHNPLPSITDEYRFAINMEIKCHIPQAWEIPQHLV